MYEIDFRFKLTVAHRELKEMMQRFGAPYPILPDAVEATITGTFTEIPSEDAKREFANIATEAFISVGYGPFAVESVKFDGISDVRRLNSEVTRNGVQ